MNEEQVGCAASHCPAVMRHRVSARVNLFACWAPKAVSRRRCSTCWTDFESPTVEQLRAFGEPVLRSARLVHPGTHAGRTHPCLAGRAQSSFATSFT